MSYTGAVLTAKFKEHFDAHPNLWRSAIAVHLRATDEVRTAKEAFAQADQILEAAKALPEPISLGGVYGLNTKDPQADVRIGAGGLAAVLLGGIDEDDERAYVTCGSGTTESRKQAHDEVKAFLAAA